MYRISIGTLVFFLFLISSCQQEQGDVDKSFFGPKLIALCVSDLEKSIDWYTDKLDFSLTDEVRKFPDYGMKIAFLQRADFYLELIEMDAGIHPSKLLPSNDYLVGGVFKMGFTVRNIEGQFQRLQQLDNVDFVTQLSKLPETDISIPWPTQYFLIRDPDGNFIQFFNSVNDEEFMTWLTMIVVEQLSTSIPWYVENLKLQHIMTVGASGNRRAVLERDGYVLELFESTNVLKANEVSSDSTSFGFKKLAFGTNEIGTIDSVLRSSSAEIVVPIEESDFTWAEKAMIAKDVEGNWIQFFNLK